MNKRKTKLPRDYEVIDSVLDRGDAIEVGRRLGFSPEYVRCWARRPETDQDYNATGKRGPLVPLRVIINLITEDDGTPERAYPIPQYLAALCGGSFVPLPPASGEASSDVLKSISKTLRETSEAVEAFRKAWFEETPEKITDTEFRICAIEVDEAIAALLQLKEIARRENGAQI